MAAKPVPVPGPGAASSEPGGPKPGAAPAATDGFSPWFHKNETTILLGGAGIVVAIALYMRSRSSSAASASAPATSSPESYAYPGGVADTSGTDYGTYASDISAQLGQLETQLSALVPGPSTSPTPVPTTPATPAAPSYQTIPTAQDVQAAISSGESVYLNPTGTSLELPVTQPGGYGGEWYIGNEPLPPGNAPPPPGQQPGPAGQFQIQTPEPAASQ